MNTGILFSMKSVIVMGYDPRTPSVYKQLAEDIEKKNRFLPASLLISYSLKLFLFYKMGTELHLCPWFCNFMVHANVLGFAPHCGFDCRHIKVRLL